MNQRVAIGVDFGGTNIKVALVDRDGKILGKRATPSDPQRGSDTVIGEMAALASTLLTESGLTSGDVVGAGLGSPGPLDLKAGTIIRSTNLPGWQNVAIRRELSDRLGLRVYLANDANAAALGEFWAGAGRSGGDLVMLTLGTGVGGGVVHRGRLVEGHFDNAAELGHMIVVVDGLPCGCGQRGCLEQYASAAAVARRVQAAIGDGEQSVLASQVTAGEPITSQHVAEAAKSGDALSLRIWEDACVHLAIACVNIQHVLNPKYIVLGGGMAQAGAFLLDRVVKHFKDRTWSLCDDAPEIVQAQLGYDAGVIGAAALAWTNQDVHR